jgi:hypothetical protein
MAWQVIYTSSMADQAFVEVLRQSAGCEGMPEEYEVSRMPHPEASTMSHAVAPAVFHWPAGCGATTTHGRGYEQTLNPALVPSITKNNNEKILRAVQVRLEKSALFHAARSQQALAMLHVRGMPPGVSGQAKLHLLNTMISLSATQQACRSSIFCTGTYDPVTAAAIYWCSRLYITCMMRVQVSAAGALLAILHRKGLLRHVPDSAANSGSTAGPVRPTLYVSSWYVQQHAWPPS